MAPRIVIITAMAAFIPWLAGAVELDIALITDWGEPTAVDTLARDMQRARWNQDESTFSELRDRMWALAPHHGKALIETIRWYRDNRRLSELLTAVVEGRAEDMTGMVGLTDDDRIFLHGLALYSSGRHHSARRELDRARDAHPLALPFLFLVECELAHEREAIYAAFARAAVHPEAAVVLAELLFSIHSLTAVGRHTQALLARLETLPPRPQLADIAAAETACEEIMAQPRSLEEVAAIFDRSHAACPEASGLFLETLLEAAGTWHGAGARLALYEPRAHWQVPDRQATTRARLLLATGQTHAAYQELLPLARDTLRAPPAMILQPAASWHPDAAELERWAHASYAENLDHSWFLAHSILRERGRSAAADSMHSIVEHEIPLDAALSRMDQYSFQEPGKAAAMANRIDAVVGKQAIARILVQLEEHRGNTASADSILVAWGPSAENSLLRNAFRGAQRRRDPVRMHELAERALSTRPDQIELLSLVASLGGQQNDTWVTQGIVDHLAAHPHSPRDLFGVRIDMAMRSGDVEGARAALAAHLAEHADDPDHLLAIPVYAEGAGWSDLADRAMDRLVSIAQEAPSVRLARARMLTRRGDHYEAQQILNSLIDDWPERIAVREAMIDARGQVEPYREPDPGIAAPGSLFGGLELDYSAVDWILDRRAGTNEFTDADMLVLRDRVTYFFASTQLLRRRQHQTFQVLSSSAVNASKTIRLTFNAQQGQPRILCARVITPGGEIREVPRSSIMITAHESAASDVSEARDLVIPFSGVQPGAVLDYCVEVTVAGFLDLGQALQYHFGRQAPQREERLEVLVAQGVEHWVHDKHAPIAYERTNLPWATLYTWCLLDTPAMRHENDAPMAELLPHRVGVATYREWDAIAQHYGRRFWQQTARTDEMMDLARSLTAGAIDDRDRLERLYTHVRETVRNIGISLGDGRFVPTPAVEVLARGYGDCKDKVAALTALLACVGIECRPVLVGTRPSLPIEDDFPYSGLFDHLIAFVHDVDGGVFCDPTLGGECVEGLSDDVLGLRGLLIESNGKSHLAQIPERDHETPHIALMVDLFPESNGQLRADVVARIRGTPAQNTSELFDLPDTNIQNAIAGFVTNNRARESLMLLSWERIILGCDRYEVRAVLRDTAWAAAKDHDASLSWIGLPDSEPKLISPKDRRSSVALDTPLKLHSHIRAHEGAGWRVTDRHAPINVSAPGYHSRVTAGIKEQDGRRWLDIVREETFTAREYEVDDYARVHDQWLSYHLATYQAIQYHRQGDPARIAQLLAYCREHPDDLAFAMQAAMQVLGTDMGGRGQAGAERRAIAREMLAGPLAHPEPGSMAFLLAAGMSAKDNRYVEADSLLAAALTHFPRDPYLISTAIGVKQELSAEEEVVALLRRRQDLMGGTGISYTLISKYLEFGQDDLAEREAQRLGLMSAEVDSLHLAMMRINGYMASHRFDRARETLESVQTKLPQAQIDLVLSDLHSRNRRWDEAIALVSPLQNDHPLSGFLNNNLAWYLACAGRELDHAEYLVRMAMALEDRAGYENTLAVILLQQGHRDAACDMLRNLMDDDRPSVRLANGYFLGLCRWLDGQRDTAVNVWRELAAIRVRNEFAEVLQETLAAVDAGEDPAWLYLWQPQPDD